MMALPSVSSVAVEPEPRGRDSVSSKQRNQSHKVVLSGCRFVCLFSFKALADKLCAFLLLSLDF